MKSKISRKQNWFDESQRYYRIKSFVTKFEAERSQWLIKSRGCTKNNCCRHICHLPLQDLLLKKL